ncbi:MAG: hypothetical protein U0992_08350 [Planctomycetaceae bacterium]
MLYRRLLERDRAGAPIQVGIIGAGTFGMQIITRTCRMPGMRIAAVADLDLGRAQAAYRAGGCDAEAIREAQSAADVNRAIANREPAVTRSVQALCDSAVDVVIEATGNPEAGTRHAYTAIEAGKHVVMVTVEADVLVGPWLRRFAEQRGVHYSMAYGDEPALAVELCDWVRALGMQVVAAGKGTRFIPSFRYAVPDDVPRLYGFTGSGYNLKVFCSFLDGTKHAIEMAALANAAELTVDVAGMHFEAIDLRDLSDRLSLRESGGILQREGVVEAISAMRADETWVERHLRGGVYAVARADRQASESLRSYGEIIGMQIGKRSGNVLIYRPQHFVGHEVPIGVARLVLDGQPVGQPQGLFVDVIAAAKRPLTAGTVLDGEGGYTVYGLCENADVSRAEQLVPMALTQNCVLRRDIPRDGRIHYDDVELPDSFALQLRQRQDRELSA